ncbi:protein fem-1 homolog CG6966 isoform X1 [Danaus plexippus]|uniref:protein fem-1 homolog CG6966 isoform X1 n=1 Tax=Danaus plexippus TaxID=13037 RepID=UPI0013C3E8D5|nr:protein fem-1 homolog CG6966 isoform X1 [Danaus plexippus]XP_061379624.1 protein fem-1 homolog CG6966 isoform X1 [Danaus plexippus]
MSNGVWDLMDLMPVKCRWIERLRRCGKTLLRRQRRLIRRLKKMYLHSWRSDELSMLVGAKVTGATPLVIACRNGHYDVAEYLIERCKADIEQPGSVTFDGETIEGAPPLWCAAAAGHMPLVRLLVRAGANVNSTTRTHSTPLRAACFDGHYDIVKFLVENGADIEIANRHGHTCLMIACYKGHIQIAKYLLSLNADVNRKSVKGNTALHDCAESGSLHILKMLLAHGATMDVDSYGMTPLLAASVTGHTHIVELLINIEHGLVTRQERIDALELLGATYVDKRRDMVGALALWKRAMAYRFPDDDREPIPKPKDVPRIEAYEYAVEPGDARQLEELLADPDAMRMQALVIRERILGPAHPDTSYYVRYRGAVYADAGRFGRCRTLWHHALDMQRAVLPPLSPLTQSSLYSFAELFSYMLAERTRPPLRGRIVPPVTFEDIDPVFVKALSEIHRGMELLESKLTIDREQTLVTLQRVLVISLHLAALMARLLEEPGCTDDVSRKIHKAVYSLVKLDIKVRQGRSALHVACSSEASRGRGGAEAASSWTAEAACPALVALMLRLGASPDVRDADGNTPLHLVCKLNPCPAEVVRELLSHGAHIDTVNYEGQTPEEILKSTQQTLSSIVNPLKYTTLKCLAARTVKNYKLPYRHVVPQCLHSTIITH